MSVAYVRLYLLQHYAYFSVYLLLIDRLNAIIQNDIYY